MSDPTQAQPATPESSAETQNTAPATQEHMIPKSRFDDVNTQLQALKKWKDEQEAAARAAQEKQAAERGEWEKVATERAQRIADLETQLTPATKRLEAFEAELTRQLQKRVRALPAEIREMQPDGDALALLAWVDKAEAAAAKIAQPLGTPAGPRGTGIVPRADADAASVLAQKRASGDYSL